MNSREYKSNIRNIVINTLRKKVPGIKRKEAEEAAQQIATAIHARFYGANVDGVGSPIWRRDDEEMPSIPAQELLNASP